MLAQEPLKSAERDLQRVLPLMVTSYKYSTSTCFSVPVLIVVYLDCRPCMPSLCCRPTVPCSAHYCQANAFRPEVQPEPEVLPKCTFSLR